MIGGASLYRIADNFACFFIRFFFSRFNFSFFISNAVSRDICFSTSLRRISLILSNVSFDIFSSSVICCWCCISSFSSFEPLISLSFLLNVSSLCSIASLFLSINSSLNQSFESLYFGIFDFYHYQDLFLHCKFRLWLPDSFSWIFSPSFNASSTTLDAVNRRVLDFSVIVDGPTNIRTCRHSDSKCRNN